MFSVIGILVAGLFLLTAIFKILREWERAVIFRFGRYVGTRGPGLIILIPGVETMRRVDTRTITMDVPPQDVITLDNISLKVNAVLYYRITNPEKAINNVADFHYATAQSAQTTLRSTLGQYQMDDLLSQRDKINHSLQEILDRDTEPWGIKISKVEVKHIDLPKEMQRSMARQAEAERERRAKVISAEGEFQRAAKLKEAADVISSNPAAIQLAYLQALNEISTEGAKTIVFPIPMNMLEAFQKNIGNK